jgi:Flp pilus assembly protein TadG
MKGLARGRKGQVIVAFALTAAVLLAMIGLAIDLGMVYLVRTKLCAAVDAAALAAGRVAPQGESTANAEAEKFFVANYPDGLLGATVAEPATALDYDHNDKSWTVTVSTTATVPAYFAKVVGRNNFTVGATATATVGPIDLVLVLDTSSSLNKPSAQTFEDLKEAARDFIDKFTPESDRIGLIRFASGVEEDYKITGKRGFDKDKIKEKLGSELHASGYTTAEEALRLAKEQLDSIPKDDQSRRRIIVFFADGAPNGVAANYLSEDGLVRQGVVSSQTKREIGLEYLYRTDKVNSGLKNTGLPPKVKSLETLPETGIGDVPLASFNKMRQLLPVASTYEDQKCNVNRAARNMTENVANAARAESGEQGASITIFTVGLGTMLTMPEIACPGYGSNEHGENILRRLANVQGVDTYDPKQSSGIYAYAQDPTQLKAAFDRVARNVLRLSK